MLRQCKYLIGLFLVQSVINFSVATSYNEELNEIPRLIEKVKAECGELAKLECNSFETVKEMYDEIVQSAKLLDINTSDSDIRDWFFNPIGAIKPHYIGLARHSSLEDTSDAEMILGHVNTLDELLSKLLRLKYIQAYGRDPDE